MKSKGRPPRNERSEVGQRIVETREALGMTQAQLAVQLDLSQQTVAFWEREAPSPRAEYLPLLAEALGVTVDFLLIGDAAPQKKRGPQSKLERQLEQIRHLPKDKQKAISTVLDMALQNVSAE